MLRWRFEQILKIAKAFSIPQYLLVISDIVAMKPRTSKESWVRRLDLLDGALHCVQDFILLDRDTKVEIPVEVD